MSEQQVVIGIDAHKRTHTMVAVDVLGRQLGERTVPATSEGHMRALEWAGQWPSRRFAVEDCRHVTRRLEGDLLRAGQALVRVPTKLMAGARRSGREGGKSDPIDALAVARAALREPDLPVARLDGPERELRLLVDHRDDLVRERTRIQSRIRWHLHEIDPAFEIRSRGLRSDRVIDAVDRHLEGFSGVLVEITRELIGRVRELNSRARQLEQQIGILVAQIAPSLLAIPGCGPLSAAKIVGESAGARRFRSRSAYARWNGTAPQPVWSGSPDRFRLSRGGNRQVNAALHRIAVTQARLDCCGHDYIARRIEAGNSRTEALRLLRRRLSDVVFRTLLADETRAALT
jgi:transposase